MSLLLDALNKTSASKNDAPASEAADSAATEAKPRPSINAEDLSLQDEPALDTAHEENGLELDAELSIDDEILDEILSEEPGTEELRRQIESAGEQAVLEADQQGVAESLEEIASEFEAQLETQTEPAIEAELETSADPAPEIELQPGQIIETADGVIIDAAAEAETLSEEIQTDAPLVAAYRKAQKRKRRMMASIVFLAFAALAGFAYKTFFYQSKAEIDSASFNPEIEPEPLETKPQVTLEEIDLERLPKFKQVPKLPTPLNQQANNVVLVSKIPGDSATLERAYAALNRGDLNTAEGLYESLRQKTLTRTDALTGLSSIALQRGDQTAARDYLQQLLSMDANNQYALASLSALPAFANAEPGLSGSPMGLPRLKVLHAEQPDNAAVAYLLGNALMKSGQWAAAQQAYFSAHSNEPDNANYAYNLAVSLDKLGKSDQALPFYREALTLSGEGADFSPDVVRQRLERSAR